MKRTTLALDEALLRKLKRMAATEGKSLKDVVNGLLRQALSRPRHRPYRLVLKGWSAVLAPGVDIADRDRLFDLLDGN
jgi:plasmid stability protein